MNTSECVLNNLATDLITENDHLNNYCLCSKCTCGNHKCPKPSSKKYPKSMFNSYYRINFKRHSISSRPSRSAAPVTRKIFKIESQTTASHDFQPYSSNDSYKIVLPTRNNETLKQKFRSNSVYKQDFSNWGNVKTESTKYNRTQVGTGVKFNGLTTYASCFQNFETSVTKTVKPFANTNILCTGTDSKMPETTMKASFGKKKAFPSQQINHDDNNILLPSHPFQYSTVNSLNFDAKQATLSIRRVKKGL